MTEDQLDEHFLEMADYHQAEKEYWDNQPEYWDMEYGKEKKKQYSNRKNCQFPILES